MLLRPCAASNNAWTFSGRQRRQLVDHGLPRLRRKLGLIVEHPIAEAPVQRLERVDTAVRGRHQDPIHSSKVMPHERDTGGIDAGLSEKHIQGPPQVFYLLNGIFVVAGNVAGLAPIGRGPGRCHQQRGQTVRPPARFAKVMSSTRAPPRFSLWIR